MARLMVNPCGHVMVDDKLEIKIVGLNKRQRVTVHAVTKEGNRVFESCCCYTSDGNGEVNLATQPSEAGNYTGTCINTLINCSKRFLTNRKVQNT